MSAQQAKYILGKHRRISFITAQGFVLIDAVLMLCWNHGCLLGHPRPAATGGHSGEVTRKLFCAQKQLFQTY